jgi:hypothetical protein
MTNLHLSQHAIDVAKGTVPGGFLAAVAVLAAISAATLIFVWFIA